MIDKLPLELVQEVAFQIPDIKDVKSLRLVNRTLNQAVEQVLWNTRPAVVHLNRDTLEASMTMLDNWKGGCLASTRIRQLKIVSLSPQKELHPPIRYTIWMDNETSRLFPPEPTDTKEVKEALDRLPDILPGALCALKGLVSVHWRMNHMDQPWARDAVLDSLASLPRLARFEVDADQQGPLPPLPFHKLGNGTLKRLSLLGYFSDPPPLSALSALLQCNPDIIELKFDNQHSRRPPHHFHQIFEQVPAGTLHLQSLYLRGWVIKPTPKMVPHIRSLHTLRLLDNNGQYHGELWKSLQSSTTSLRRLTVNYIKNDLLAYLESFEGLEELSIIYPDRKEEDATEVPRRFYTETLRCHSESLRRLEVLPRYEGSWTIGLNDVNAFDYCTTLTTLTVGLKSDDVQPEYTDIDVVTHLIARLYQIPSLKSVALRSVIPNTFRDVRLRSSSISWKRRMRKQIRLAVEGVQSQVSSFPRSLLNRQLRVSLRSRIYNIGDGQ